MSRKKSDGCGGKMWGDEAGVGRGTAWMTVLVADVWLGRLARRGCVLFRSGPVHPRRGRAFGYRAIPGRPGFPAASPASAPLAAGAGGPLVSGAGTSENHGALGAFCTGVHGPPGACTRAHSAAAAPISRHAATAASVGAGPHGARGVSLRLRRRCPSDAAPGGQPSGVRVPRARWDVPRPARPARLPKVRTGETNCPLAWRHRGSDSAWPWRRRR